MQLKILIEHLVCFFNRLFVLIPCLMAFILSMIYINGGWAQIIPGHNLDFYFLRDVNFTVKLIIIIFLWGALVFFTTFVINLVANNIKKNFTKTLVVSGLLCLLAILIRSVFLCVFAKQIIPFSDFFASWERAKGNMIEGNLNYYSLFPSYLTFSIYENGLIQLFGEKYSVVLFANAIVSGLTAGIIYLFAKELVSDEKTCILSGVLYTLYPSNIVYCATGTPDFLTIFFNSLGILVLLKSFKIENNRNAILFSLLGGIFLGIGSSFKNFSIIIVIAFIIVVIAQALTDKKAKRSKVVVGSFLMILSCFGGYKAISSVALHNTSEVYGVDLTNKSAMPHFLLVGLNTESEGQIHIGTMSRSFYQYYLENDLDYEGAKNYAYSLLKDDWKAHKKDIVPNLGKKMIWAWQDDYTPINYFLNNVGISPSTPLEYFVYHAFKEYGSGLTQIIYSILLLFAIIGSMHYVHHKYIDFSYEFICLIIFGYFCMLVLSEAQSRYKCLVMGYIVIVSSIGIQCLEKRIVRDKEKQ